MDWLGGGHIKGLIHKFYPKMNDSCLGLQLHWCPIRLETSWVLQLSNRFHKTLLVKSFPPQCGTQPRIYTLRTTCSCAQCPPLNWKGVQGFSSSHVCSFSSGWPYLSISPLLTTVGDGSGKGDMYILIPSYQTNGTKVCPKQQNPRSRSMKLLFTHEFYNDERLQKPDLISKLKT